VREYKATIDNMQDEIRMLRQLVDKKWLPGASPRVGGADQGNRTRGREGRPEDAANYYNDADHDRLLNGKGRSDGASKRGSRNSRSGDTTITHEEIVELACTVLRRYPGGMAIAKLGTLMHKEANNHALPSILKERYGGLKKFLQGQQDKCLMGNDHPYNPHVTLRQRPGNYMPASPGPGGIQVQHAIPNGPSTPVSMGGLVDRTNSGGAVGDHYLDHSPSAFRRAPRRRRSKKSRGVSPTAHDTRSPSNHRPHDLLLAQRGGPNSPAARLLPNTSLAPGQSMRAGGNGPTTVRVPTHPRHSASSMMTAGGAWSGVVSAPGTPLGSAWSTEAYADHEAVADGRVPRNSNSVTPDAGSRSSSLFTSSLSTRLRTNVLKSAYTIRLPPYTGGPKTTRQVSLACGVVRVSSKAGESECRVGRVVVINLYGHVLYDEVLQPRGDIVDFNTRESGISPADMKRTTSPTTCRNDVKNILAGRLVIAHNIEKCLRELKISIPATLIRDTAKKMCPAGDKSLHQLAQEKLGIAGLSVRNPTEDARAAMALYWSVHDEWEHSLEGSVRQKWPLPTDPLPPHEEVKNEVSPKEEENNRNVPNAKNAQKFKSNGSTQAQIRNLVSSHQV